MFFKFDFEKGDWIELKYVIDFLIDAVWLCFLSH